ncbi:hypothetical protein PtA15_10A469 [Puccinia triticina]|uniref:Actin interacting protein 3 C-terminal domain-containing protein n=1 Tax=Puccinia triticina TaxID=208348 RepID=A0ABY7CUS8_9BASI|nr:uncharacterized protein PtA15_10A469 [Puccinia triticina]WAQ89046.1 hypothetical protein PtA15_10A469 [Puccinia triticina]
MTRPSAACLDRLENQADSERVKRLTNQLDQFFVQASKHSIELKAYLKLIAEAEKNARSDPNSQHWQNQIQDKSARQSQVEHAINQVLSQAVEQIDQHIRTEAISIIRALLSDGFFDKPGKNSINSNVNSAASSTAIKTIEKNVENERKEREESLSSLKKEFEQYRTFNNTRFNTLQASFEEFKESNENRFKNLEDTHRKQISSLKAGIKLSNPQQQQQLPQNSPQPPLDQPETQQLKRLVQEQVSEQLVACQPKQNIPNTDLISIESFQTAIKQIREQLDELSLQTTETLKEFEPQIKQITQAIQVQVIKSTKTVISDGHQDIAALINDSIVKLQDQVDNLEPIITSSSEKISQIESTHSNVDSQIDEKVNSTLESKLNETLIPKLEIRIIQKIHSNLEAQINKKVEPKLEAFKIQFEDLAKKLEESDKRYNVSKAVQASLTKVQTKQNSTTQFIGKLDKTITDVQSQFKEFELRIKPLQDRIDGVETTVQNSKQDNRQQSRRLSTPAHQAIQSSHSLRRTSQTPPSPHSHSSSNINNAQSQPFLYPSDTYNQATESQRPLYKGNRTSISSSSVIAQNIPIASRLTNGPSQAGPPAGSGQANGEMAHYRKRTLSRESSISRPSQSVIGSASHWPPSVAPLGNAQSHNYATPQPASYDPQSDHTYAHAGHQQIQQPVSSIPLAKRLKNDYNHYHANHDQQASYQHLPYHQHQQQAYHNPQSTHQYKKNVPYTKRT